MRNIITLAALIASSQAFGQGYYDAQSQAFIQQQQMFHQQQQMQAQQQQMLNEQMRQQRAIMNSYGQTYGNRRPW